MGMVFENLTEEELCDLMCGDPEEEPEDDYDDYKAGLLIIDEKSDPNLYQEILKSVSKYRKIGMSWGDIYYELCKMLQGAMYDVELEE